MVAVPLKSSLIIEADLWDNSNSTSATGGKIASGSAAFSARCSGTTCELIHGPDGCIDVKVTWLDNPYRSPGMERYWEIVEENRRINRLPFAKEGWGHN